MLGLVEGGLSLARILLSQDVDISQRQMSVLNIGQESCKADSGVLCWSTA